MSEPAEVMADSGRTARDQVSAELARELGIDQSAAETLVGAGYRSPAEIRTLSDDTLQSLGLESSAVARLKLGVSSGDGGAKAGGPDGSQAVERWMATVRKTERPRRKAASNQKDSTDVLRKWVEGDDRALEDWIQASETQLPARPRPEPPKEGADELRPGSDLPLSVSLTPSAPAGPGANQMIEREATLVRWLTDLLDRVKTDQFDPATLLQEVQDLHRQLYDERARQKQLAEELEHVKRGSIAVIKFVRSREARARDQALHEKDAEIAELKLKMMGPDSERAMDGPPGPGSPAASTDAPPGATPPGEPEQQAQENAYLEREAELRRRIVQLEGEVHSLRGKAQARDQRDSLRQGDSTQISSKLTERIEKTEGRERDISVRENEMRAKFEEVRTRSAEIERQRESLLERERLVSNSEETLARQRSQAEAEETRLAAARAAFGNTEKMIDSSPELQQMREELARVESELKARDELLQLKGQELETVQSRLTELEKEFRPTEATPAQVASGKIHSGVRRLDDLMFGGLPSGAQVLINGPAHTGKEVLARLFIAEGLKQGIPGLWIVSDKTYLQIREEMTQLLPNYPTYEQQGMVRYVDLYSRSLGVSQADAGVRLLSPSDKGVLDQILAAVNGVSNEFKERAPTYRLVFESVSTVTAYLDTAQTLRFLQPFAGRRKLDSAASYYLLETGMHSESDLQTLEHMMDGSFNLKVEALKTFLSIRGLTEVQSRAWIGYTFAKKAFSLGSFSLDKIR